MIRLYIDHGPQDEECPCFHRARKFLDDWGIEPGIFTEPCETGPDTYRMEFDFPADLPAPARRQFALALFYRSGSKGIFCYCGAAYEASEENPVDCSVLKKCQTCGKELRVCDKCWFDKDFPGCIHCMGEKP